MTASNEEVRGMDADGAPRRPGLQVINLVPPSYDEFVNARSYASTFDYKFILNREATAQERRLASGVLQLVDCRFKGDELIASVFSPLGADGLDAVADAVEALTHAGREQELADKNDWDELSHASRQWFEGRRAI